MVGNFFLGREEEIRKDVDFVNSEEYISFFEKFQSQKLLLTVNLDIKLC